MNQHQKDEIKFLVFLCAFLWAALYCIFALGGCFVLLDWTYLYFKNWHEFARGIYFFGSVIIFIASLIAVTQ